MYDVNTVSEKNQPPSLFLNTGVYKLAAESC